MGDKPISAGTRANGNYKVSGEFYDGDLFFKPKIGYGQWDYCDPFFPCPPRPDPIWAVPFVKYPVDKNRKIVDFINDRAGKQVISLSDNMSIDVSRGKANDGEMKIRIVNKDLFSKEPAVKLIIVKADGIIYEEDLEEKRVKVGELSREDASALIAGLYGKGELGTYPAPSDKHIESVMDAVDIFNELILGLDILSERERESREHPDYWNPFHPIYFQPLCPENEDPCFGAFISFEWKQF